MMPAGEELDVAVAKALGWTFHTYPSDISPYWTKADGMVGNAQFSTDAEHIPEMLAWLNERKWRVELSQSFSTPTWGWHGEAWPRDGRKVENNSDTIQHALANLIVQVAERKEPTP